MKNITNSLMPLAALVLFGTCLVSVFGLLVVLMTSAGFADGVPLFYYQRLNVAVISVALTDCRNDSLHRNFARASKKIRRSRQTNRHRRRRKLASG